MTDVSLSEAWLPATLKPDLEPDKATSKTQPPDLFQAVLDNFLLPRSFAGDLSLDA